MSADPDLIRIGANRERSSITARADDPITRGAVLLALQRMQSNALQVQNAIKTLQVPLGSKGTVVGTNAAKSKNDLRDSILTLVISMGFIERSIGALDDQDRLVKLTNLAAQVAAATSLRPLPM